MNTFKKTVQRSDDYFIQFTDSELKALGIKPGDKFSWEIEGESVMLKKYVPLEIDLADFSRDTLEFLIALSIKKDLSVNDVICELLEQQLEKI